MGVQYQTLSFKQTNLPVSFHFTFVYFDTYSYDERIYGYRKHVLYAYSFRVIIIKELDMF